MPRSAVGGQYAEGHVVSCEPLGPAGLTDVSLPGLQRTCDNALASLSPHNNNAFETFILR